MFPSGEFIVFGDFYESFGVGYVAEDEGDVVVDFFGRVAAHVPFAVGAAGDRLQAELCVEGVDAPGDVGST